MGRWLKRNPVIGVLALLAALLAAVLAVEISTGGPKVPAAASRRAVPAEAKLLPAITATAPEQAYPETGARPLFAPTRRPAPAVVATPQPTIQRNQFALLGVIIVGDNRIAMLRERSNGRVHRVEKGREINGMKVAEIQPESVTLAAGAEQEALTLTVQKAAPGQQPAAVAVAPLQGPFGAPSAAPPGSAAAPQGTPPRLPPAFAGGPNAGMPQQVAPSAAGAPMPVPVQPNAGTPNASMPQPAQAPMTPEELLERRRARRAQQTQ